MLLSLLGSRWWVYLAGAAVVALLVGSARLDATRARGELAVELERSQRLAVELESSNARAIAAEHAVQTSRTAMVEATKRCERAQSAASAMADTEARLRAENARYQRELAKKLAKPRTTARCPDDVLDDAFDLLHQRQGNDRSRRPGAGAGAAGVNKSSNP